MDRHQHRCQVNSSIRQQALENYLTLLTQSSTTNSHLLKPTSNFNHQSILNPNQTMLLPTLRRSLLTTRATATARAPLIASNSRAFSQSPSILARKDTQDKDSLKPEPNEYSISGSDDAAAAVEKAAFDPSETRPEQESATAERESGSDVSLEFSLCLDWTGYWREGT
jgi:hypothetical protein